LTTKKERELTKIHQNTVLFQLLIYL
jgi:hypothetical protein